MAKYRQFFDKDESDYVDFTVFIIHGRSPEIHKVERFIKDELNFNAIILKDSFTGKNIIDKFKDEIWDNACCAVAIMSPDDKLNDGNFRTRQNVIYELGYCSGVFDGYYEEDEEGDFEQEPVIIIKEKSIDMRDLSDLLGVEYLEYTQGSIEVVFNNLRKALNTLYKELKYEDDK
jgi:predicted nucleotide-binding protein